MLDSIEFLDNIQESDIDYYLWFIEDNLDFLYLTIITFIGAVISINILSTILRFI